MMRVFSSRRASITADLRARAARFEQRYGRAPSQRELAQLAQASNFKTRAPEARRAGFRAGARGLGGQARAHPRREPGLGRAVGVAWRNRPRGRARARRRSSVPAELELARAAQKAVALAQQEKSTWTRADVIKYLGRVLPRTGLDPAAAAVLLEDLADRALARSSSRSPAWRRPSRPKFRAACCAPTGAASTSGTAASGTPRARSW